MAKKKLRRALSAIKAYLTPLQTPEGSNDNGFRLGSTLEPYSTRRAQIAQANPPRLSRHSPVEIIPSDDEVERINRERQEQAKLNQAYEQMAQDRLAQNLNLKSQHKLLIATLITALVALISAFVAIGISLRSKPPVVNVQSPSVNVQPPDVTVKPNIIVNPVQGSN
jgi:hypothetical protein